MTGRLVLYSGLIALVWLSFRRPKTALLLYVFFLGWQGTDFSLGLRWNIPRIILGVLGSATVVQLALRRRKLAITPQLWAFLALAALTSLVQAPFLPDRYVAGGWMRSPHVRAVIQVFYYGAIWIYPFLVFAMHVDSAREFLRYAKGYVWGLVTLAGLGYVQAVVWFAAGYDLFPIGYFGAMLGGETRNSTLQLADYSLLRINSFGGEPKMLATSLLCGLLFIQALLAYESDTRVLRQLRYAWIVLAGVMVLSFSTSGYYGWVICTAFQLALLALVDLKALVRSLARSQVAVMLLLGIGLLAVSWAGVAMDEVSELTRSRTVGRVGSLDEGTVAAMGMLAHDPSWAVLGTGLGNLHLFADDFVPDFAWGYVRNSIFKSTIGAVALLSELGVIGLVGWLLGVWSQLARMLPNRVLTREHPRLAAMLVPAFLVCAAVAVLYLAVSFAEENFYTLLAAGATFAVMVKRENLPNALAASTRAGSAR